MPVREISPGRFRWGEHGAIYRSRAAAERQGRAIRAAGWHVDAEGRPLNKRALHQKLGPPVAAEARFRLDLVRLFRAMHAHVEQVVFAHLERDLDVDRMGPDAYQEPVTRHDAPPKGSKGSGKGGAKASKGAIVAAAGAVSPKIIGGIANAMRKGGGVSFDRMALAVNKKTLEVVPSLIRITPKSAGIEDYIAEAREDSLDYLEKAGRTYATQVRDVLSDPDNFERPIGRVSKGEPTPGSLADLFKDRADVSTSKAMLIARTTTGQLNAGISRRRMLAAGVVEATWSSSNDERVRAGHRFLDGQRYSIEDGISADQADEADEEEGTRAGEPPNCRCVAVPVIGEDEEEEGPEEEEEEGSEEDEDESAAE